MISMGYVDDKYWQSKGEVEPEKEARISDPSKGSHGNNKVSGVSNPIMLPTSVDAVVMGALKKSEAEIYTKEAAEKFPVSFSMFDVIVSFDVEGDRADVRCYSAWNYENEKWILRIVKKLDTGNEYDVSFEPGQKYDFTIAAFDHNANRHSYNHQVYRLYFPE